MSIIASRLQTIQPSATLAISAKAKELKEQGIDVISLAAGEPDFDTPENIKQAAIQAINEGETKYTAASGTLELKKAICQKFSRENNLIYTPEEIIVSNGGKQVIYNLFMATLEAGDEVIIQAPYWLSYPDIIRLAAGVPVVIDPYLNDNFQLNCTALLKAITSKTKWLILNSPNNPSGTVYSESDLIRLAKLLAQYPQLYIMCDDIYEHIIFDQLKFSHLANLAPELKRRIFIVNGVSKSYAMTGWRIGYGAGDISIIKAMTMIQSQSTSSPCSISQKAALEALTGPQHFITENISNFRRKRDLAIKSLENITNISCIKPHGAFYLLVDCSKLLGKFTEQNKQLTNCRDLAQYFLEESKVATVPASSFGLTGYLRLSFATSENLIKEACERIAIGVSKLSSTKIL